MCYMIQEDDLHCGEYFWYEKEDGVYALRCINRYSHNPNEESGERCFLFSHDLYSTSESNEKTQINGARKLRAMTEPEVSFISIMFHYLVEKISEPICLKTQHPHLSYHDGEDGRVWHMSFVNETFSRRHFLFYEKDMNIEELRQTL